MSHPKIKYWESFITRAEAQKVYDEQAGVISAQAMAITKLDTCLAFLCEKFGIKPEDVQKWAEQKATAAKLAQESEGVILSEA